MLPRIILILVSFLLIVGCATTDKKDDEVQKPAGPEQHAEMMADIRWLPNIQTAANEGKKQNKPIMIFFTNPCKPCVMMNLTFDSPAVAKQLNDEFVVTRVQASPEMIKQYKLTAYPACMFFRPDGSNIGVAYGYISWETFPSILEEVKKYM